MSPGARSVQPCSVSPGTRAVGSRPPVPTTRWSHVIVSVSEDPVGRQVTVRRCGSTSVTTPCSTRASGHASATGVRVRAKGSRPARTSPVKPW